jgi:asparagine synthase (glutamine-hydrolysing)
MPLAVRSRISGVVHLDGTVGSPLRPAPGGQAAISGGEIATTAGAGHRSAQPVADPGAGLVLVWDGRVDNRDELRAAIPAARGPLVADTDADLVLRAYETWGDDCVRRVLGDFAFAVWDGRGRRLFCARDLVGCRPFFYRVQGCAFRFSSEIGQLLDGADDAVDEGVVGELLAGGPVRVDGTLHAGVKRLPPACTLVASAGGIRVREWFTAPDRTLRYRDERDYAEHFRQLFRQAVTARLHAAGPVTSMLSGGIDSSAIVATWASLGLGSPRTVSLAFPGTPMDETPSVESVARRWALQPHWLEPPAYDWPRWPGHAASLGTLAPRPVVAMHAVALEAAAANGGAVVLTGEGGDDWFGGRNRGRATRTTRLRCRLGRVRRRLLAPPATVPAWISPRMARTVALADRLRTVGPGLRDASSTWIFESQHDLAAACGVDYRHPFHDRRLVEFGLSLPPVQLRRDGLRKWVVREAMRDLLPEDVRTRPKTVRFGPVMHAAFRDASPSLLDLPALGASGWLTGDGHRQLRAALRQAGERPDPRTWESPHGSSGLWWLVSLEAHLQRKLRGTAR